MFRELMRAKIHRARVTDANLGYVGSLSVDSELLK
ncbi:MAG: aspartate 1-decarboxylase, partial [bacterium]